MGGYIDLTHFNYEGVNVYHVLGYTGFNFAQTALDLTPLADAIFTVTNGHYLPDKDYYLYGGFFGSTDLTKVTLVTPTARQIVPPLLYPIANSPTPPDRFHFFDRRNNPFRLRGVEEIQLLAAMGGAANERITAVLLVGSVLDPAPTGDIYTIHGTSTTAAVANAWTQIVPTYDQVLPAGQYSVIATQHQSANAIAHRLIFKDQVLRPGFLSQTSLQNITLPEYYYGGMGMLGRFTTYSFPQWEVWANGADAAHDVTIFVVKTG